MQRDGSRTRNGGRVCVCGRVELVILLALGRHRSEIDVQQCTSSYLSHVSVTRRVCVLNVRAYLF
jgi:hypothetical protein